MSVCALLIVASFSSQVWQLGSSSPNFTLEGHEKGVNCIDYYSGGDKPYLISGADDRLVKIWDYQVRGRNRTSNTALTLLTAVVMDPLRFDFRMMRVRGMEFKVKIASVLSRIIVVSIWHQEEISYPTPLASLQTPALCIHSALVELACLLPLPDSVLDGSQEGTWVWGPGWSEAVVSEAGEYP